MTVRADVRVDLAMRRAERSVQLPSDAPLPPDAPRARPATVEPTATVAGVVVPGGPEADPPGTTSPPV